jgi:hypothetical protein
MTVFFDALDGEAPPHKSGVIQPEDGDASAVDYAWDFGDPKSGAWPHSGRSRNEAYGAVAAHVYQTPGVYTVTLKVTDKSGKRKVFGQKIQVLPLEGPAFFVSSSSGNDQADGKTPATAWRSLERARQGLEKARRLYLKRGDSFTLSGPPLSLGAGETPGHLGAYGMGEAPLIRVEGKEGGVGVFGDDWRITDLRFVGPGETDTNGAVFFNVQKPIKHTLLQRLVVKDFRVGLGWVPASPLRRTSESRPPEPPSVTSRASLP